ncbi:MAG: hypothetical protein KAI66_13335 [Lentisphaeria bacterium]|nr:hypothetical protein [Lentisphaeria bacterium]
MGIQDAGRAAGAAFATTRAVHAQLFTILHAVVASRKLTKPLDTNTTLAITTDQTDIAGRTGFAC